MADIFGHNQQASWMAMVRPDGVPAAPEQGRPKAGSEKGNNVTFSPGKGNTTAAVVARIKRDRPDIGERLAQLRQ
jgi:hypothetical protein